MKDKEATGQSWRQWLIGLTKKWWFWLGAIGAFVAGLGSLYGGFIVPFDIYDRIWGEEDAAKIKRLADEQKRSSKEQREQYERIVRKIEEADESRHLQLKRKYDRSYGILYSEGEHRYRRMYEEENSGSLVFEWARAKILNTHARKAGVEDKEYVAVDLPRIRPRDEDRYYPIVMKNVNLERVPGNSFVLYREPGMKLTVELLEAEGDYVTVVFGASTD